MDTIERLQKSAEEVYAELGGKHTEATYHRALERELSHRGVGFTSEGTIPIFYRGVPVGKRRPDMFVDGDDGTIVVELKAGSTRGEEQLLSYSDILSDDSNFDISHSVLIRFNDDVEFVEP